jgi:hypothetical protein
LAGGWGSGLHAADVKHTVEIFGTFAASLEPMRRVGDGAGLFI